MEAELLKALLQAVRENNSELKAIRRLLEAQNREGLVMPESPNPQNSQETESWNNEVDRLFRGELG
ncbi:MAG: hypothetical protein VXZ27_06615 [SAR324 cluster bacterium]|jgi:hypothetical protein|nr:hypothetical protein [SAR324 cluster bacterium]MEC8435475.1 hypothetical protein [SAR324 cluster bacterium]MEC8544755.1 hypothetical protein [SAR324 cluster bacterium]